MPRRPRLARPSVLLSLAVVASFAVPGAAAAQTKPPKLKMGIYDCYSYDSAPASLDYDSSIKLIRKGRYEATNGRRGRTMVKKSKGTYRIKGARMTFKGGMFNRIRADIKPGSTPSNPAKFNLRARNGKPAGITCTYVTDKKVNP